MKQCLSRGEVDYILFNLDTAKAEVCRAYYPEILTAEQERDIKRRIGEISKYIKNEVDVKGVIRIKKARMLRKAIDDFRRDNAQHLPIYAWEALEWAAKELNI